MEQLTLEQAALKYDTDNFSYPTPGSNVIIPEVTARQWNINAFTAGAEWQKGNNWISVQDRLPMQNSNSNTSPMVLVWSTSDEPRVTFYLHDVHKWFGIKNVTHWAHIINPEQPQDGGKNP